MRKVCRFTFKKSVTKDAIEEQMASAIVAAESTFGQAKVRLNAGYAASDGRAIVDVSSKVGEHIAEVFTWLVTKRFGEKSFSVERLHKKDGL